MTKINILFFIFWSALIINAHGASADSPDLVIVSSEPDAKGTYGIYLRHRSDGKWTKATEISVNDQQQLHPTIAQNKNGDTLVAWTQFSETNGTICSRFFSNGIRQTVQKLETDTSSDIAPSLALSPSGTIWLSYSGTGTNGDEIYLTRWLGTGWDTPFQVNNIDTSPDIQPEFSYDESGRLQVLWKGFYKGSYVRYVSTLANGNWSVEKRLQQALKREEGQISEEKHIADIFKSLHLGSQAAVLAVNEKFPIAKSFIKSD
jgi:hypothetical protein